jgi:hypothetical protein
MFVKRYLNFFCLVAIYLSFCDTSKEVTQVTLSGCTNDNKKENRGSMSVIAMRQHSFYSQIFNV